MLKRLSGFASLAVISLAMGSATSGCAGRHTTATAPGVGAGTASALATGACFDPSQAPPLASPREPSCDNDELLGYDALVVFAPHPDDESLGFGGLAAMYREAGKPVSVFVVTDGDAYCE